MSTLETDDSLADVLTLSEAADYLKATPDQVVELVTTHRLPGRPVGDGWRFLKAALQDWLRTPAPNGRAAVLAMAGAFKDDPYLEEIVREAYRQRGRPITDTDRETDEGPCSILILSRC